MSSTKMQEKASSFQKVRRTFSDEFKRKKVWEIERKISSVTEISREYGVTRTAIYKWIHQFSAMSKKKVHMVVESQSDTRKILELKDKIAELEKLVGQKQILLEFQAKMIDLAEEMYEVDIKKKLGTKPLTGIASKPGKEPGA